MSGERLILRDIDEAQLIALAGRLAPAARSGGVIHLVGELGVGKTTVARALLSALGVGERVKSPTYSLIESYCVAGLDIHHLDLYRIADAGEVEWLGLADLWGPHALMLIEWPERAARVLPRPDLELGLLHAGQTRTVEAIAYSASGRGLLDTWKARGDPR